MTRRKLWLGAIATALVLSATTMGGMAKVSTDAAGQVPVMPYIQYTFDDASTMFNNTGSSATDTTKDYTLQYIGNSSAADMCYLGDVELIDNGALYLDGANNPFANGALTDFTVALDVTAEYSSWVSTPISWDGITGDADNADTNDGNWAAHKYMRVSVPSTSSSSDWMRFTDSQSLTASSPHWESYGKGSALYTGDRTLTTTPRITLIISVDTDSSITVKAYRGIYLEGTVTKDLTGKNWDLYEDNADYKRFTLGAAYDSRDSQHLQMKMKGRLDNVRIYDFAMTEAQMQQYATSDTKELFVDGVQVDDSIVGGSLTVDKVRPAVGETVTITPTADANARLDKVTVDGVELVPVGGVYQTTMKAGGIFVSANFVRSFAVNVATDIANGTLVADKQTAEEGETVTFTVTPNQGYGIKAVTVNGAPITAVGGVYSWTMLAADMNVTAEFSKFLTITVKDNIKGGTVTVNKTSCWEGDMITISAKADEGYEIKKVTVNGVEVQKTGIIYKFTATEDAVVDVQFVMPGAVGCGGSIAFGGITAGVGALSAVAFVLTRKKRK